MGFVLDARFFFGLAVARCAGLACCVAACNGSDGQERSAQAADAAPCTARALDAGSPDATEDAAPASASDASSSATGDLPAVVCSDGQIAAAMQAQNAAEVGAAQTLRGSLSSAGAVALADKLLTDHSLLLEMLQGALRSAEISPADAGIARAVANDGRAQTAALQALSGVAADQAYVDREVLMHVQSLTLVERVFAPTVRSDRLAYVVQAMQDLEGQHLAAALAAQAAIEGACPSDADARAPN